MKRESNRPLVAQSTVTRMEKINAVAQGLELETELTALESAVTQV